MSTPAPSSGQTPAQRDTAAAEQPAPAPATDVDAPATETDDSPIANHPEKAPEEEKAPEVEKLPQEEKAPQEEQRPPEKVPSPPAPLYPPGLEPLVLVEQSHPLSCLEPVMQRPLPDEAAIDGGDAVPPAKPQVQGGHTPSVEEVEKAISKVRAQQPQLGAANLLGKIKGEYPSWILSEKRLKTILKHQQPPPPPPAPTGALTQASASSSPLSASSLRLLYWLLTKLELEFFKKRVQYPRPGEHRFGPLRVLLLAMKAKPAIIVWYEGRSLPGLPLDVGSVRLMHLWRADVLDQLIKDVKAFSDPPQDLLAFVYALACDFVQRNDSMFTGHIALFVPPFLEGLLPLSPLPPGEKRPPALGEAMVAMNREFAAGGGKEAFGAACLVHRMLRDDRGRADWWLAGIVPWGRGEVERRGEARRAREEMRALEGTRKEGEGGGEGGE